MSGDRAQAATDLTGFDVLLGPAGRRYFGTGYRGVDYGFADTRVRAGRVAATAAVSYPRGWSLKESEPERKPHLGTLDTVVLAAGAAEALLAGAVGLDAGRIRRSWVESLDIRAGTAPFEELARVPVELSVAQSSPGPGSDLVRTSVGGRIGGMSVSMTLCHEPPGQAPAAGTPAGGGLIRLRPQSDLFRGTEHASSGIRIAEGLDEVTAVHRLRPATDAVAEGLGAAHWPSPTAVDAIVLSSQMAQVLIYRRQGLSREATRTLWMRRVSYRATEAPECRSECEWDATLGLVSQKVFRVSGEMLSSVRVVATLGRVIGLEADLAYFDTAAGAKPSAG